MIERKFRSYEVSVWTLQDDFITVLKPFGVESKTQLQDPKMTLNVDGTQEFSFKIPMYVYTNGIKTQNPELDNYLDRVIIANLRKIKVILNKGSKDEEIYEFLIIKVTEQHDAAELYYEVECEGLAFHELGKTGYKISLSADDFYAEDYEWFEGDGAEETKPVATIDYWMQKFMEPYTETGVKDASKWYYVVDMDWSGYACAQEGISNKIYEDEYVASWKDDEGNGLILVPNRTETYKEKERLVNLEESNKYNLTQDLAEAFGVYCKYVYEYDDNYRIIGRKVVFYNSFIEEGKGPIDINYKYNTTSIKREIDGSDLVTKMFVRPVDNSNTASGLSTIIDVGANKSREDYLLNFDYLYSIGAISQNAYDEIPIYEKKMYDINKDLAPVQERLVDLRMQLPEAEAKVTLLTNAIVLDQERISQSNDFLNQLTNASTRGGFEGELEVDDKNPKFGILLEDKTVSGTYYVKITEHGVRPYSIHVYKTLNFSAVNNSRLSGEIQNFRIGYDEFGNVDKVMGISVNTNDSKTVYLTYSYKPKDYYENVRRTWTQRLAQDEADKNAAETALNNLKTKIQKLEQTESNLLKNKSDAIEDFGLLMGPALREGYWQPDDYKDYGDIYMSTYSGVGNHLEIDSSNLIDHFIWDTELFDDEQDFFYEVGADQNKVRYPIVDLSSILSNIDFQRTVSITGVHFYNTTDLGDDSKRRFFGVGSLCQYGFATNGDTIRPVLIITGAASLSEDELNYLTNKNNKGDPCVGLMTTSLANNQVQITAETYMHISTNDFLNNTWQVVQPRIKIDSLALKTSEDQLVIKYNNKILKNYDDFYILSRSYSENEDIEPENEDIEPENEDIGPAYYITIKPEVFLTNGSLNDNIRIMFTLSNADTSIYLDAVQVLKDSSYPQVSYTLDVALVQKEYIRNLAKMLGRIVHINDPDLKFIGVQGYVSIITLLLDEPWEDEIEIKNYKTKFEDLFTKIVASTEQMKKTAYIDNIISESFLPSGQIASSTLKNSLSKIDLNYSFNNGKLTIDDKNGIWGVSDSGVVAYRGGGIFTATEQDREGNWLWNTGITPEGINADLITTGQLDTNRIKIYAGDQVRLQLNGEGFFAYKSLYNDDILTEAIKNNNNLATTMESRAVSNGIPKEIDAKQYVVHNAEGLFLIAEPGATVLNADRNNLRKIDNRINRVAITWDGLSLRNWDNKLVFYADADTGNLTLAGRIQASSGWLGGGIKPDTIPKGWIIDSDRLFSATKLLHADDSLYSTFSEDNKKLFIPDSEGFIYNKNTGAYIMHPDKAGIQLRSSENGGMIELCSHKIPISSNSNKSYRYKILFNVLPDDSTQDDVTLLNISRDDDDYTQASFLKYSAKEGLIVKGNVRASSGIIGPPADDVGWIIGGYDYRTNTNSTANYGGYLYSSNLGTFTSPGVFSNKENRNGIYLWSGKDGNEGAELLMYRNNQTFFRVSTHWQQGNLFYLGDDAHHIVYKLSSNVPQLYIKGLIIDSDGLFYNEINGQGQLSTYASANIPGLIKIGQGFQMIEDNDQNSSILSYKFNDQSLKIDKTSEGLFVNLQSDSGILCGDNGLYIKLKENGGLGFDNGELYVTNNNISGSNYINVSNNTIDLNWSNLVRGLASGVGIIEYNNNLGLDYKYITENFEVSGNKIIYTGA